MKKLKGILGQYKEKTEIISEWINDVNIRIKASKMFKELKKNKSIKQFENEYLNHF